MDLHIIIAQPKCSYPGQYAPLALDVMSGSNYEDEPAYLDGKLAEYNKRSPRSEMAHIDYGFGVLSAGVLGKYGDNLGFDMADIYQELSLKGCLAGFEVGERFYEIGSHQGIKETEDFLLAKEGKE